MKSAVLLVLLLAGMPRSASACTDPVVPSFQDNLGTAEHVFVFRLTSLELTDTAEWPSDLKGNIKVVRVLKGPSPATSEIALIAGSCCSTKLSVGNYYLAAWDSDPSVRELVRGDQSILDVTDDFQAGKPGSAPNPLGLWPVQKHLQGVPLPADYPSAYQLEATLSCLPYPEDLQLAPNNSFKGMPLRGTP